MRNSWIKKYIPTLVGASVFAAIGWLCALFIASFGEKPSYDVLFSLGLPILVAGIIFGMIRNPVGRRAIKKMEAQKKKEQEQQVQNKKKKQQIDVSTAEKVLKLMFSTPVVILGGIFLIMLSVVTSL